MSWGWQGRVWVRVFHVAVSSQCPPCNLVFRVTFRLHSIEVLPQFMPVPVSKMFRNLHLSCLVNVQLCISCRVSQHVSDICSLMPRIEKVFIHRERCQHRDVVFSSCVCCSGLLRWGPRGSGLSWPVLLPSLSSPAGVPPVPQSAPGSGIAVRTSPRAHHCTSCCFLRHKFYVHHVMSHIWLLRTCLSPCVIEGQPFLAWRTRSQVPRCLQWPRGPSPLTP